MQQNAKKRNKFFNGDGTLINTKKSKSMIPGNKILYNILGDENKTFIDFIQKCLQWDPEKRLTPKEALEHPWIKPDNPPILNKRPSIDNIKKNINIKTEKVLSNSYDKPIRISTIDCKEIIPISKKVLIINKQGQKNNKSAKETLRNIN